MTTNIVEALKQIITRDFVLGFCCCGLVAAGMAICWLFNAYCQTADGTIIRRKFKITKRGTYRTYDGRRAFVSNITTRADRPVSGIIEGDNGSTMWDLDGKENPGRPTQADLVSKW
jgi:hypothetical protein